MWRTWDLAPALTQYQPGFGASNNSGASTISNFRIRSLWAKLSVDKRTSGPYSPKKGNYLYRYYCVMDPICWWPEKHAVQYTMSVDARRHSGEAVPYVIRVQFEEEATAKKKKRYDTRNNDFWWEEGRFSTAQINIQFNTVIWRH